MGNERVAFIELATDAGLEVAKEVLHLLPDHPGENLAIQQLHVDHNVTALDVACSTMLQSTSLDRAAGDGGYRAHRGPELKLAKSDDKRGTIPFIPWCFYIMNAWHHIDEVIMRLLVLHCLDMSTSIQRCSQTLNGCV